METLGAIVLGLILCVGAVLFGVLIITPTIIKHDDDFFYD